MPTFVQKGERGEERATSVADERRTEAAGHPVRGESRCVQQKGDPFRIVRGGGSKRARRHIVHQGSDVGHGVGRKIDVVEQVRRTGRAREDEQRIPSHGRGSGDVGVEAVADDQRPFCTGPGHRGPEHRSGGLADDRRGGPGCRGHGGQDGTGSRPQSIRRRIGGVGVRGDEASPPLDQQRRRAELRIVDRAVPADHHEVGGRRLAVNHVEARRGQGVSDPSLADDEHGAPPACCFPRPGRALCSQQVGGGKRRGQHFVRGGADPHETESVRDLVRGSAGVVRQEQDPATSPADRVQRVGSTRDGPSAAVDDAVEVE